MALLSFSNWQLGDHKLKECEVLQCTCGELVRVVALVRTRLLGQRSECRVFPWGCPVYDMGPLQDVLCK